MFNKKSLSRDNFILKSISKGSGVDVIVIGSHLYYPRTFSENLYSYFRFHFMDHRGFAESVGEANQTDFTIDKIIDDIEAFRLALRLENVIVLGHSVHALMAIQYTLKYQQYVKGLMLIATSPFVIGQQLYALANEYFEKHATEERKKLLAQNLVLRTPQTDFITRMLLFAPMLWYNHQYDAKHLWADVVLNPVAAPIIWGPLFEHCDVKYDLSQISCPIFLGLGLYDYWNPPYLWDEIISNSNNNITRHIFEHSGHNPQLEESEQFSTVMIEWLKKIN